MDRDENTAGGKTKRIRIDISTGSLELEVRDGVHPPSLSSMILAKLLDVAPGETVLEVGCGLGLLAVTAAKLGASRVVATDLNPCALEATARNAHLNGVDKLIELREGSWYEALVGDDLRTGFGCFHMIIATPPQTPGPVPFGPRYGGWDGADLLRLVIGGAPAFLDPAAGRLWLLAISLAHPSQVFRHLRKHFSHVSLVQETERFFMPEEYDALTPGLSRHLFGLRAARKAEFTDLSGGRYAFRNLFIRASGPRKP